MLQLLAHTPNEVCAVVSEKHANTRTGGFRPALRIAVMLATWPAVPATDAAGSVLLYVVQVLVFGLLSAWLGLSWEQATLCRAHTPVM